MKYYLIAGEASGDLHGSNLIRGLKEIDPQGSFRCRGGDLMQAQGAVLSRHYKETAVMGFVEVLQNLGKIRRDLRECKEDILRFDPDILILIDYPGFNFRIAEFAQKKRFTVYYYIAPKVWAWKEKRVRKLQKFVDKLFIIFPFEIEYFKKWNIPAIYRGNPLLDSVDNDPFRNEAKESFFRRTGLDSGKPLVALLAGSRKMEIKFLLPRMLEAVRQFPGYQFILAAAPSVDPALYRSVFEKSGFMQRGNGFEFVFRTERTKNSRTAPASVRLATGETYAVLRHADAAIISSGTASLEAALIGTPQVVCYGGNEISYRIAKRFVKLRYISLANLILDKQIFLELIQHDCTPETIGKELHRLVEDRPYRQGMQTDYAAVRRALGGEGASRKVAQAMIETYREAVPTGNSVPAPPKGRGLYNAPNTKPI